MRDIIGTDSGWQELVVRALSAAQEFNLQDRHNGEPRSSGEREGTCVPVCVFTLACAPMR